MATTNPDIPRVHVYTAPLQPATNFLVDVGDVRHRVRYRPGILVRCRKCKRRRWAKNCVVQEIPW